MRLALLAVLSLSVIVFLAACSDEEPDPEPSAALATSTPPAALPRQATASPSPTAVACPGDAVPGLTNEAMQSGGTERTYRIYVPTSYDASEPLPLVLNFHGFASSAEGQESESGFVDIAESNDFILVTPDGTGELQEWYILGDWEPGYVDDVAFVDDLIDEVSAQACIDPARVYATGFSNGGGLTFLLACNLGRIAAIAAVAGVPFVTPDCEPDHDVPVIAFHGTEDYLVPFDLGEFGDFFQSITTVRQNTQAWAEHNGCDPMMRKEAVASDVVIESYTGCDDDADVQLYVVDGGGHTWPGSDDDSWLLGSTTHSISASELIWQFFAEHSLQSP